MLMYCQFQAGTKDEGWCQEGHPTLKNTVICSHMDPSFGSMSLTPSLYLLEEEKEVQGEDWTVLLLYLKTFHICCLRVLEEKAS